MRCVNRFIGLALSIVLGVGSAMARPPKTHHRSASSTAAGKRATSGKAKAETKTKASRKAKTSKKSRSKSRRVRGQQSIDSARAFQIQEALIRENYLTGEPNGVWDQRTKDAMARYQADHGWQTKMLPDSRALIRLGLGPDHSNLINPEVTGTTLSVGPSPGRQD